MRRVAKGKRVATAEGTFTVNGKAANGEGSIYRERDGTWRATYRVPGVARPRRVRGRTREETLRRRDEALADALAGAASPIPAGGALSGATTVDEFARWWLRNVAANRVRASSLGKYEDRVERIPAWLGDVELGALRPEHVATWQTELLTTLSARTVAATRSTLRSIIEEAVNLDLISTNPVSRVRPPRAARPQRRALTAEQGRALVSAAASERLGAAVALLFVQGWRVSEVLGLAWSDLDLDACISEVRRACSYADGVGMVLGPPKTDGAIGRHHLTPVVVELLRRRRQAQLEDRLRAGEAWESHTYAGRPIDLVFTTAAGGLLLRQTVAKAVSAAAERTGIDPAGLGTHAGRSTAITARTPRKASTSPTSRGTSATPTRRPRPATSATSAVARLPPPKPLAACSIHRWTSETPTEEHALDWHRPGAGDATEHDCKAVVWRPSRAARRRPMPSEQVFRAAPLGVVLRRVATCRLILARAWTIRGHSSAIPTASSAQSTAVGCLNSCAPFGSVPRRPALASRW